MKKRDVLIVLALIALLVPVFKKFQRARAERSLVECKKNLKDLSLGMEMYSTDWSGHYPRDFGLLIPGYLEETPLCPVSGLEYGLELEKSVQNLQNFADFYHLQCKGSHHGDVMAPSEQAATCSLPGYPDCSDASIAPLIRGLRSEP